MRFLAVCGLAALAAACSGGSSVYVPIGATLVVTQGALDGVTKLTVSAFDVNVVKCDTTRPGYVTGDQSKPAATKDLASTGCAGGAKYCGDVQFEKGKLATATFVVAGKGGDGQLRATGCAPNVALDKDTQQLTIKVYRYISQAMCGGKPSPYFQVQCATPGNAMDPMCDAECLSKELYLSSGSGGAGETSDAKTKTRPSFAWPAGGDALFFGFMGDQSQSGRTQVSLRVLASDMTPCTMSNCTPYLGQYVEKYANFMPNDMSGTIPTTGDSTSQTNPAATFANDKYFVAFEDGAPTSIKLRSISALLRSDQGPNAAVAMSTTGHTGQKPVVAAGAGGAKVLVVWQEADGIHGRVADAASPSMTGADVAYGAGTAPSVAGTPTGFVVAWQSGADVKVRATDATGAPSGAETKVNDATHQGGQQSPSVASLPTGHVAVVWSDSGASPAGIFVQRYLPGLMPVMGDQSKRINDAGSAAAACTSPVIGAGSGADAFYVAAWLNGSNNHVHARFLDGTGGFLFNPVDGQSSEFQASRADSSGRANVTVAVGGAAPYVAIGWESVEGGPSPLGTPTGGVPAVWARRFPVPTK